MCKRQETVRHWRTIGKRSVYMKTLNKAVARYNGISLIVRILIGLIVGAVLALVAPGAGWVGEFGNLFVGAL